MSCSHLANFLKGVNDKRYISDFEEISKIGSGGFSSVFKVKNKLDDNFYAVKKIQLRIKDIKNDINAELERVLREAKFLAKVFHPNVIRYYNSWIELKLDDKNAGNATLNLKNDFFFNQSNSYEHDDAHVEFCLDEQKQKKSKKCKKDSSTANDQSEFVLEIDSTNNLDIAFEDHEKENISNNIKPLKIIQDSSTDNNNHSEFVLELDSNSNCDIDFDRSNDISKNSPEIIHKPEKNNKKKNDKEQIQHPQPQKNPIFKLLDKKAAVQKFDNSRTPPPKNSKLDYLENIKSILIYIQTELCERTLEKYINERNHKLALIANNLYAYQDLKMKYFQEAKIILEQVISALAYIHKNCQLVHRDLKPSNIFLNKDLNVKIGDFGLVKKLENLTPIEPPPFFLTPTISQESSPLVKRASTKEIEIPHNNNNNNNNININKNLHQAAEDILMLRMKAQTPDLDQKANIYPDALLKEKASFKTRNCGTKVYASPEQMAQNCYFDFRADIYSLGIIMIQLFYPMKTEMELIQTINNGKKHIYPKELTKDLPQISKLIGKMLDENPEGRPSLKVNFIFILSFYS